MPYSQLMSKAVDQLQHVLEQDPNVHTVMWGRKKTGGAYTGEEGVVVLVEQKLPMFQVVSPETDSVPIPKALRVRVVNDFRADYVEVPVDVQQKARPVVERCRIPVELQSYRAQTFAANVNARSCWSPLVPAGAQIAPLGADWVGTLGVPWWHEDGTIGFLTNRHVVGTQSEFNHLICQPIATSSAVGFVHSWGQFTRSGVNTADVAFVRAEDSDNRYLVDPRILGLGSYTASMAEAKLGDLVAKHGRTTDLTFGHVEGLNARTKVNYGEDGVLTFADQIYIETSVSVSSQPSAFSKPGDSGSGVWIKSPSEPNKYALIGLLFAGSDDGTFVNPVSALTKIVPGSPFVPVS